MIEGALVRHGQQGVLVSGVELLCVASEGFGSRAKCKISQAAFFELGEFAADIVGRASDDPRNAVLAAERYADPSPDQPFFADERTKSFCQFKDALLRVKRIGLLAPAN